MFKRILICLLALCLTASPALAERLPDSVLATYYDGSLFVGDSLVRMLRNYIAPLQEEDPGFFRDVTFCTAYSYTMLAASQEHPMGSEDAVNLMFRGQEMSMVEIAGALQPPKLFFLAGLNDTIGRRVEAGMGHVERMMGFMDKYAKDTRVYFFSLTPVTNAVEQVRHLQDDWDLYNEALKEKCGEVGATYIDISTPLKGSDGLLPMALSQDGEYHLNEEGNAVWVQALLDFAQSEYDAGRWVPDM
ncbi:MAG: hypothetical protein IJ083_15530 [Clostridia bacterium]|nr:hypothetical protein [Clostridia bacterium]